MESVWQKLELKIIEIHQLSLICNIDVSDVKNVHLWVQCFNKDQTWHAAIAPVIF